VGSQCFALALHVMSRARLREFVVLCAIGSALTLAVFFLALWLLPFGRLLRFLSRDFLGFSDFTSSGTAGWAANRSLNFLFTVRSGTIRVRHRTMADGYAIFAVPEEAAMAAFAKSRRRE
jgi:hypothetical protein